MTYTELARVRGISKSSAERLVFRNHWRRQRGNNGITRALVPWDSLTGDSSGDVSGDIPPVETPDTAGDVSFHARALAVLEDSLAALREAKDSEIATLRDMLVELRGSIGRAEERAEHAEGRATNAEARIAGLEANADQARAVAREAQEAVRVLKERADVASALVEAEQRRTGAERARAEQTEMRLEAVQAEVGEARAAAETLQSTIDELKAGQALMQDMQARELEQARAAAQEAAAALRLADEARKARGRWARLRAAWRGN
jgi:chromosome segregation ATPase